VELAGRNPDLAAEAELAAVGELSRGVPEHDRAVDAGKEAFGRLLIGGDDGVGVLGAEARDMLDRAIDAGDGLYGDNGIEKLTTIGGGP
jgi:hypothetical protein